jgi:hypothetical protein
VIANQHDLQHFKKLNKSDLYYEMNKKLQDDVTAYLAKQSGKELNEKKLVEAELKLFQEAKLLEINNLINSNAIENVLG